jgi:uncharacterized caspase-like protein
VGFQTTLHKNLDKVQFKKAVTEFGRRLTAADEVVLYYSGHGAQHNGHNYLVPIGALDLVSAIEQAEDEAVALRYVLAALKPAGVSVVIIDACRHNPFKGLVKGEPTAGMRVDGADGALVA